MSIFASFTHLSQRINNLPQNRQTFIDITPFFESFILIPAFSLSLTASKIHEIKHRIFIINTIVDFLTSLKMNCENRMRSGTLFI